MEREALALTWPAEKFEEYILGTPLRLMRYDYDIQYLPGKTLIIADCLSRSTLMDEGTEDELGYITDTFMSFIVKSYPIRDVYLEETMAAQTFDEICNKLKMYSTDGWKKKSKELSSYYQYRTDINFVENALLKGMRIAIPSEMQEQFL